MQFLAGLVYASAVGRVNDEDETLGSYRCKTRLVSCTVPTSLVYFWLPRPKLTAKVMSPKRTNLVLTTDIPDVKLDILVGDRLDVEADGRNGGNILAELELVENCRLSSSVETEHEQAHLLGSEDLAHDLGQLAAHGCCSGCGCARRRGIGFVVYAG